MVRPSAFEGWRRARSGGCATSAAERPGRAPGLRRLCSGRNRPSLDRRLLRPDAMNTSAASIRVPHAQAGDGLGPGAEPMGYGPLVAAALVRSFEKLSGFARRLTGSADHAADLVQATCLRALERAHTLRNDLHVEGWIFRIMRNLHTDQMRNPLADLTRLEEEPVWSPEVTATWRQVDDEEIERTVSRLPHHLGAVWRLIHEQRLDQAEVAGRLGIRRATVATRIFRARVAMRKLLEETPRKAEESDQVLSGPSVRTGAAGFEHDERSQGGGSSLGRGKISRRQTSRRGSSGGFGGWPSEVKRSVCRPGGTCRRRDSRVRAREMARVSARRSPSMRRWAGRLAAVMKLASSTTVRLRWRVFAMVSVAVGSAQR